MSWKKGCGREEEVALEGPVMRAIVPLAHERSERNGTWKPIGVTSSQNIWPFAGRPPCGFKGQVLERDLVLVAC